MKFVLRSLATASTLLLMAVTGAAADWKPAGPITMLIGFAAGGGADTAYFGKAHFSTYHTYEPTGTPECVTSSAQY